MRLIQINLNHCEAAQDLLSQTIRESNVDVAVICEPYRNYGGATWAVDASGNAAIWACGRQAIQEVMAPPAAGFIRTKVNGVHIYSCYAPPSATLAQYEEMLDSLVLDARDRSPKIIAGDFNAWALEWGSRSTNTRGQILLESFAELDIVLANVGCVPTFRGRGSGSIVDLTFVSTSLVRGMAWQVSEHYTHSDHQAIFLHIGNRGSSQRRSGGGKAKAVGWSIGAFDEETFLAALEGAHDPDGTAVERVTQLSQRVTEACDATMPRRRLHHGKRPNYWWNTEIAALRSSCLRARRLSHRTRGRPEHQEREEEYRDLRSNLKKAIRRSKRECYQKLCMEANTNPWGTAYQVVMKKIRGRKSPQVTCPRLLLQIIATLFPQQEQDEREPQLAAQQDVFSIPDVTEEELWEICRRIGDSKAPGLDGIPNRALKVAVKARPRWFASTFESCMAEGVFPAQWKRQKLVLLPKPRKPPGVPSSYRPICLLDTMGKMLERVIYNRLLPFIELAGGLSERQYGFRRARSTVDAVAKVVELARNAMAMGKCCALVTLDVKNAFNSANWGWIKGALAKLGVPSYLARLIESYFSDRLLWYETDDGPKEYIVTAGVPQGSVLGPLLWNIMYDGVLGLRVPEETTLIGFADDLAVVAIAKHPEDVELYANEAIHTIKSWLRMAKLDLADEKTEAVLITNRRKNNTVTIRVGNREVVSKSVVKYLGVMIDAKLSFKGHLDYAREKAANASSSLARMMPNVGGPKYSRRLLIAGVVRSILLYAAPVWAGALNHAVNRRKICSAYRPIALRVCSAFRTASTEAVCVIAGMIPIDLLASEAHWLYEKRKANPAEVNADFRKAIRRELCGKWQQRWDNSDKGRWTHTLIPCIEKWVNRKHGELNYHLTQFLTGHGGYRKYLHRFELDESPNCPECGATLEDPEHVMFHCPRFLQQKRRLNSILGADIEPSNLVEEMLKSEENWMAVNEAVAVVQTKLLELDRARKAARRRRDMDELV